jgi:hypothetical protein
MQSIGSTEVKVKSNGKKVESKKKTKRSSEASKETLHLKAKGEMSTVAPDELTGMIAKAAYFCAEHRHFEPGHELEDWLTAEQQVKATLLTEISAAG